MNEFPDPSNATDDRALCNVFVVDALMGAGKTSAAIREMREIDTTFETDTPNSFVVTRRFIYITPFLDEVDRVCSAVDEACGGRVTRDPFPEGGSKLVSLNKLLADGHNIVSTHALFRHINRDTTAALDEFNYTLFIDEVSEWVSQYPISTQDLKILLTAGVLVADNKTKKVRWIDDDDEGYTGRFGELRAACLEGKIVIGRTKSDGTPTLLLWQMPVEVLSSFERVYILTHLFDGSDMAAYLKLHGVPVERLTVGRDGTFVPYDEALEAERVAKLKPLIRIVRDPKLNAIGSRTGRSNPMSVSWFKADRQRLGGYKAGKLQRAVYAFFQYHAKAKSREVMWSTFKDFRKTLSGKGYAKAFVSCNARATNEYKDRTALAYLVNLYRHPFIAGYFADAGAPTSEDFYALSTMSQWIFRSAIRVGQPIDLYVPSERMRTLLIHWLDGRLPKIGEGDQQGDDGILEPEEDEPKGPSKPARKAGRAPEVVHVEDLAEA